MSLFRLFQSVHNINVNSFFFFCFSFLLKPPQWQIIQLPVTGSISSLYTSTGWLTLDNESFSWPLTHTLTHTHFRLNTSCSTWVTWVKWSRVKSNKKSESECASSRLRVFLCERMDAAKRSQATFVCLCVCVCVCVSPVFMSHSIAPCLSTGYNLCSGDTWGARSMMSFHTGRKRKQLSMVHKTFCTRMIFHFWEPSSTHNNKGKKKKKKKKNYPGISDAVKHPSVQHRMSSESLLKTTEPRYWKSQKEEVIY